MSPTDSARRASGAIIGGLGAELALFAVMLLGEKLSGKPSELIELERSTARKLDVEARSATRPPPQTSRW